MGMFDWLTGTKRPAKDVTSCSPDTVHAALHAVNSTQAPYSVRDGTAEGVDLVGEWRLQEPAWQGLFARSQLSRAIKVLMRLDPAKREVRTVDQQWKVTWVGGQPKLVRSSEYGRGNVKEVSVHKTIGRNNDGKLETSNTFRFNSGELKEPPQNAVLECGWTWRVITYGKV